MLYHAYFHAETTYFLTHAQTVCTRLYFSVLGTRLTSTCPPGSGPPSCSRCHCDFNHASAHSCWGCIHSGPRSGGRGGEEKGCPRPGLFIHRVTFIPLVAESLGGWSEEAASTIKAIGRQQMKSPTYSRDFPSVCGEGTPQATPSTPQH